MAVCSFDGCGRPINARGYCRGHRGQLERGEKLRPLQVQHHGYSEKKRFLMRVGEPTATGCREWTGSIRQVKWHGQWRNAEGSIELTHRAAWRIFVGPIPEGMFVLHKCDNPLCVNPNHLFLGSQSDNLRDMWSKDRAKPGVSLGEKHGMSKLTADQVLEIRSSSASGADLARKLGVTQTTISEIRRRKTWNHL